MQSKYKNFFLTFIWSKQSMDTFWDEIIIKQNETPFRRWNGPSTTWFHSRTCLVIKVLMNNKSSYYQCIIYDRILECLIDSFLNSVFLGYNLARYPIPGDGLASRSNRNQLKWWWWWKNCIQFWCQPLSINLSIHCTTIFNMNYIFVSNQIFTQLQIKILL